jgi:hypothetical protein
MVRLAGPASRVHGQKADVAPTRRLNLLGQVAGVASTEFGLAQMIYAAVRPLSSDRTGLPWLTRRDARAQVSLSTGGNFVANEWQTYLLFLGLLIVHGILNVRALSALSCAAPH